MLEQEHTMSLVMLPLKKKTYPTQTEFATDTEIDFAYKKYIQWINEATYMPHLPVDQMDELWEARLHNPNYFYYQIIYNGRLAGICGLLASVGIYQDYPFLFGDIEIVLDGENDPTKRVKGKGVGTAAVHFLQQKAIELQFDFVRATIHNGNTASLKLFIGSGFDIPGTDFDEEIASGKKELSTLKHYCEYSWDVASPDEAEFFQEANNRVIKRLFGPTEIQYEEAQKNPGV